MADTLQPRPTEEHAAASGFVPYTAFPPAELQLEQWLGPQSKFQLPDTYKDSFVKFLPWVALLTLPLHFAGLSLLLGLHAFSSLFGGGSMLRAGLSAAMFVLDVMALPGLFNHARRGWAMFAYVCVLGALRSVLSFSIFDMAISAALVWLAFQVKYRYH